MSAAIPRRRLPGTRLMLPELGFGSAPLGNLYRPVAEEDAQATLSAALAGGIRYFDTAPFYGFGLAEKRLGAALPGDAIVSTKVGRILRPLTGALPPERHCYHSREPFEPEYDYSHDGVLRAHESSLVRLQRDRVELLLIHDIGRETHGARHTAMLDQLFAGGGLRALDRLRGEGAIDAFGLGVNEAAVCLELMERVHLDAILLAGRYTLLEQDALDALLPRCLAEGTSVVVGGPYNSGVLAGGRSTHYNYAPAPANVIERARRIEAVCMRHHAAAGAAALQFVLAHPAVVSVIPGLAAPNEVAATLERYHADLPTGLWDELKMEGLLRADAPTPATKAAA